MQPAMFVILATGFYAAAGVLFAIPFMAMGAARLDPQVRGAGWGFRLLIFPGVAALWPLLLLRWIQKERGNQ